MHGYTLVLIIGEAKRRKNLGIPPREKTKDITLPKPKKKPYNKKIAIRYINI